MKLASYKDGSRDGQLVVVSRDLASAHYAAGIATRLQQVLDDWNFISPQLQDLYQTLNGGKARHAFPFDPAQCMAPLPRAGQWASAQAYPRHLELVHGLADSAAPLMQRGASDQLLGPCDRIEPFEPEAGLDFGGGLAVITGDVARGAAPEEALEAIRLLMLCNDCALRGVMAAEAAAGFGFLHSKPATAFGPVAVTPDELGDAWRGGRVHLSLQTLWNGKTVGLGEAGPEMRWHFGELIAHLARTRAQRAGSIVGGGTVANQDASRGYACIAEKRALEVQDGGAPKAGFLQPGDSLRFEMKGSDGQSVFGAIAQSVAA